MIICVHFHNYYANLQTIRSFTTEQIIAHFCAQFIPHLHICLEEGEFLRCLVKSALCPRYQLLSLPWCPQWQSQASLWFCNGSRFRALAQPNNLKMAMVFHGHFFWISKFCGGLIYGGQLWGTVQIIYGGLHRTTYKTNRQAMLIQLACLFFSSSLR